MDGDMGSWEFPRLRATCDEVHRRAEVTPGLTAVRHSGDSATYQDLAGALTRYDLVAESNGLGVGSSLVAAILHCLPRIGSLDEPSAVATAVGQVVEWLARDIGDGYGMLRSVG